MKCFIRPQRGNDKVLYDKLLAHFNLSEAVLDTKISVWQQMHGNTSDIPTISQLEIYQNDSSKDVESRNAELIEREKASIKAKAIANGTFMKAPNGKPTNLTEQQWLTVRTKAFKEWFGDWERVAKFKAATVIWGHPASGKTYLFNNGRKDIIDFDSEYKVRINKLMGLPEGADAKELRNAARKARKQEYHDLIMQLFDEAVAEAKRTGKKLLVSDMMLLNERQDDIDVITQMSDAKFIERSHLRGEHDEANKMLWKKDINEGMKNVRDKSKIIYTDNFLSKDLKDDDVSKVVDANGEPLVVYHGTLAEFNTFDFEKLGNLTGKGYYIDKNTGERVEIDSSFTFFFTNDYNSAKSYKNLAIWEDNKKKAVFYRNLYAVFTRKHYIFKKLDADLKEEQKKFIDNVLSPIMGFNVRKTANEITTGTSTLTEEEMDKYADIFHNMAIKLDQLTDARSISNMSNNLEHDKQNLKFLLDNKKSIISGNPIEYFKDKIMYIDSGYGDRSKGDVYLMISLEKEGYYVSGLPGTEGQIKITDSNYEDIIKEFNRGIAKNESALIEEETKGKYNSKGHIMGVFLNIKNPLEHDYESSAFPDKYKNTDHETAYIAARQVKKALQNNNDGVIYKNVQDPFIMDSYGIFNSNQVKSATDNNGEFSKEDNNIYHSEPVQRGLGDIISGWVNYLQQLVNNDLQHKELTVSEFNKRHNINFGVAPDGTVTTRDLRINNISVYREPNKVIEYFDKKSKDKEIESIFFNLPESGKGAAGNLLEIAENAKVPNSYLIEMCTDILNKFAYERTIVEVRYTYGINSSMAVKMVNGKPEIFINPDNLRAELTLSANPSERFMELVAHELIHCLTVDILSVKAEDLKYLSTEAQQFYNEINKLYDSVKDKLPTSYGITNVYEFAAEAISNKEFQQSLAKIKYNNTKSLLDRIIDGIIDALSRYLGINVKNSALEKVFQLTENLIFSKDNLSFIHSLSKSDKMFNSQTINSTLLTSDTKINIYAGTNENADLSNFAERPFIHTWKDGKTTQFNSVEQAFQFAKARMADDKETARQILNAKSGAEAKRLGEQVKGLDTAKWNADSSKLMKAFIRESFQQNNDALQRLLSTGNATLTHTQDKSKWGTEFPKLLMEVREELRPKTLDNTNQQSDNVIEYTPQGKQRQIYTIIGSHIYNKDGVEVFKEDSVDRNKIFANLAVSQKRAVVVEHKGHDYVVNNKGAIISTVSGKIMQWDENNGDRKAILAEAQKKFDVLNPQSLQSSVQNTEWTNEDLDNVTIEDFINMPLRDFAKGINPLSSSNISEEALPKEQSSLPESIQYDKDNNMVNDTTSNLGQEMNRTWTPKVISMRAFRIAKMFSDEVTKLEKALDEREKSPSSFENRKNIITSKIGVQRILETVRQQILDTYCNKDWVTEYYQEIYDESLWNTSEFQAKVNYMLEQGNLIIKYFEPLCIEANNEIKQNESVSIFNKDGDIISVAEEEDEFDENNVAKHNEGYFSKVHEESTEETLAREIRLLMSNIYAMDEEGGYTQFDDLDEPIPYDFKYIHATTLNVVSKVISDTDMIPALQKATEKFPWMSQILDALLGRDTFTNEIYEGLSEEEKKAKTLDLQAKFWNGYHKLLINIATQEIDEDGKVICKIINNPEGEDAAFKSFENTCYTCKTLFNGKTPYKSVYKKDATFNEDVYNELYNELIVSGLYKKSQNGQIGQFTNEEIDLADRALKAFGVDVSKESISRILNPDTTNLTDSEIEALKNKVLKLHEALYKGFYTNNKGNNTPLSAVLNKNTPKNVFDAFKSNYHILAQIFGDETMGFEESNARFKLDGENKKLFSHILPNPISKIFNKLFNIDKVSEDAYKRRVEQDYLNNWWFRTSKGVIRSGWLKDFYENPKLRAGIRLKTLKASKEIGYSKEIDSQAEITRLNEFFNQANRRLFGGKLFTDYSVPAFSDTSESYYCSGRYYNIEKADEYNELKGHLKDVLRQELDRINLVRRRAEINRQYLAAGKPLPIKPIASWDISFKENNNGELVEDTSKPSGNQFHFFPMLNETKEGFIAKINELDNNPQAQDELIGRAVEYALNLEFEEYLKNVNAWGINKLEKSPYKETARTGLVSYIKSQIRPDIPNNIKAEVNSILKKLENETMTLNTYNTLISQILGKLAPYIITYEGETAETAYQRFQGTIATYKFNSTNVDKLRDYFLNSFYASTQIIELTMRDPAFLGSPDKFQKRFKQFYSPVATCYTSHYMYDESGNVIEVTDLTGTTINDDGVRVNNETSITISDNIMSEALSIDNVIASTNSQVKAGKLSREQGDEIIQNMRNINSADAQCYRTLLSWQKCLNCIGQAGNTKAQKAIQKLMDGTWSYEDYNTVWQVFKPFVSSYMNIDSHVNEELPDGTSLEEMDSQYDKINAPTQHKNSEFLMLAIYGNLSGVLTQSPKFKALNQFMVDHNIDKVQFESAVKVSNQGCIDLNGCTTAEEVKATLEANTGLTGNMKAEEGNQDVIHTIPFSDWGISTSMPEHLLEHEKSSLGTQIMKIIMEDIHPDMKITIGKFTKTRDQWLELYQALFTQDLMESFSKVEETLTNTTKLAAYLKKQILSQNKYSQELIKHLELDEEGNFKNPIIDPMLRSQFDSLCASLLRNDVTKRPFRMGALPQVASWSFEDKLQLRFQDSKGRLILTKEEFNNVGYVEIDDAVYNTWEEYQKYAENNATRIAYLEVFMPLFDNNFLSNINDAFIDKQTGKFDFDAFSKVVSPELLEAIGYRVPSEAKHSMIPLKVKGFLPSQNSSCIMIAPEWIAISDSDNDGDKLYTLFYESQVVWDELKIKKDFAKAHNFRYLTSKEREDALFSKTNFKTADYVQSEAIDAYIDTIKSDQPLDNNGQIFKEFYDRAHSDKQYIKTIKPVEYKLVNLERISGESDSDYQHRREMSSIKSNSLAARNNLRLSLMKAILQTEENTAQVLIPGGFPEAKRVAKFMKKILNISKDTMSICNPAIRTMHQIRNMAGANLISIYANYRSLRPLMQLADLTLHPNYRITINGNESLPRDNAGNITWSLSSLRNAIGQYITNNISNFLGCAVDNAKEPLLSFLGQSELTAPISMMMINMGYSIKEVAIFMNQPIIKDLVKQYYLGEGSVTLKSLIKTTKSEMELSQEYAQSTLSHEIIKNLPIDVLADQIQRNSDGIPQDYDDLAIQHQVLLYLEKILSASDALNNINSVTRADTQNGAAKSKSSFNKQKVLMIEKLKLEVLKDDYPIKGAANLITSISRDTAEEDIATSKLPQVAAFRFYGLDQIPRLFKNISLTFNDVVDKVHEKALEISGKLQLSTDTIDALTNATASYFLTTIKAFSSEKVSGATLRLRTIHLAVSVLNEIKQKNLIPDNMLIQDLVANRLGTEYSKFMPIITLPRRDRKNQGALNNYRRAWESLLANGDKTIVVHMGSKPFTLTYKDVSDLLLKYCFFTNGMSPSGNSFINCYPPSRIEEIEGYIHELKAMMIRTNSNQIDNIIDQFVANHPDDNTFSHKVDVDTFNKIVKHSAVIPTKIEFTLDAPTTNYELIKALTVDGENAFPYIYVNNRGSIILYKGHNFEGKVVYTRCNVLGNTKNGYLEEYDYNRGIDFLDEESAISIIAANRVPSFNTQQKEYQDFVKSKQAQESAEGINPKEFEDVLKSLAGDGIKINLEIAKYNSQTTDLTGVEFCAII